MNCPHCGKEMVQGTMYTDKYPYWTQSEKLPIFRAPKDAIVLRPAGDTSTGKHSFPIHDFSDVLLCQSCHTVLFQYQ